MSIQVIDSGLAQNTGTGTASTMTLGEFHGLGPAQAGDLVVVQVMERNGTNTASHGSSSGYSQRGVKSDQGTTVGSTRWMKVLTTGETTGTVHTFTFSTSAAQRTIAWIVLRSTRGPWANVGQAESLFSAPWHTSGTSTTVNWPGFTTDATEPVTLVGFANTTSVQVVGGIPNPAGTTEVQETQTGSAAGSWRRTSVWYQLNVPIGAIATKSATLGTAAVNQGGMIAVSEPPEPVLAQDQDGFRFYADDGNEATSTPLAGQNVDVSMPAGQAFHYRARVFASSGTPTQNTAFRVFYSVNGGAWTLAGINTDTNAVHAAVSTNLPGGDTPTTQRLTGSGAFNPGQIDDSNASTAGFTGTPAAGQVTEVAYNLILDPSSVTIGDVVDLRVYDFATPLDAYSQGATITVSAGVNTVSLPGGPGSDEIPGVLLPSPGAVSMGVPGASTEELTSGAALAAVAQATTRALVGAASDESSGALTAVPQSRTLPLVGQGTDETTGTLTAVPQARTIALTGQPTDESAGTLTVQAGATTRPLTGPGSDESTGTLAAVPQARTQPLTGLSGDETTGSLTTAAGTATRLLVGANTEELPGSLSVSQPAANTIPLTGAASDELAGNLLVQAQTAAVSLSGAGTDEAAGTLVGVPQAVTVPLTGRGTDELPGTVTPTQVPPNNVPLIGALTDELAGNVLVQPGTASLFLAGATTDELPGTLVAVGEGPPVTQVPLTGASGDEIAGAVTPVPGPATVQLVGAESDELPGKPYEPEAGTPPLPVILYGIVERPCATVGVRDPPRALIGVAERPRARVGVVEQDETSVTIGVRDTPGALLGVR